MICGRQCDAQLTGCWVRYTVRMRGVEPRQIAMRMVQADGRLAASTSPFLGVVEMFMCRTTLLPFGSSRHYFSFGVAEQLTPFALQTTINPSDAQATNAPWCVESIFLSRCVGPIFSFFLDSSEMADLVLMFSRPEHQLMTNIQAKDLTWG